MPKLKVVSGYVPIRNHPRSAAEYGKLGEKLGLLPVPTRAYYLPVERCWLHQHLVTVPFAVSHSEGDNPAKNSLDYHIVQHQKFQLLYEDAMLDPEPDVFIWIDYGIYHIPSITPKVIADFLAKVKKNDLAIPGCWPAKPVRDDQPCWRFCGGVMVVPRNEVSPLFTEVQANVARHLKRTHNVSWEVNTLARVELDHRVPIRWYKADHDATIFSGYTHEQD